MKKLIYIIKYTGPFGFIKPWTAVRDEEVYSQQFLTPSIISGIEKKLFPELLNKPWDIYKIIGHRLNYEQISQQQEQIQPKGWNSKGKGETLTHMRPYSILKRGILVNPILYLAFHNKEDAHIALQEHICLARNEDMLYPTELIETSLEEFNNNGEQYNGFELVFEKNKDSFLVGYNRYNDFKEMYGWLKIVGTPVSSF